MAQTCECCKDLNCCKTFANKSQRCKEDEYELEGEKYLCESPAPFEPAVTFPQTIFINESVSKYPDIQNTEVSELFEEMSIILGINDYKQNIFTFWLLDMFLEGLNTAQIEGMDHRNQKATLLWIAYFYNIILAKGTRKTRKDAFQHLKFLLLTSEETLEESTDEKKNDNSYLEGIIGVKSEDFDVNTGKIWEVPFPPVWKSGVKESIGGFKDDHETSNFKKITTETELHNSAEILTKSLTLSVSNREISEQNVHYMEIILEILYHIFGRLWSFIQIQTLFIKTPSIKTVNLPFELYVPKQVMKYDNISLLKMNKQLKMSYWQKLTEGKEVITKDFILPLQAAEGIDDFLKELFFLDPPELVQADNEKIKLIKKKKK